MTRALIVGAGSIGLRHARVLAGLGHDVAAVTARDDLDVPVYRDLASAVSGHDPEYVVIATETARHHVGVAGLLDAGYRGALLIEKPLAVDPSALTEFERVGVAFNLRFHPVIVALRAALAGTTVLTVEAYAGQHLSGWRPGRPVEEQYSAHADAGGGALRDLSHELDYLASLFGPARGVFARGGRLADVTVDSDDAWGIVAEFATAPIVTLQVNYLDTRTRRRLVINTGATTIEADLIRRTLTVDGESTDFAVAADDTYRAMHEALLGGADGVTTVAEAAATDALINMIETSAATREWVTT
ncbi:MAG: Gfo/Idh/MocA family oxidoreductase [Pseudolysinimonas sp.]